MTEIATTHNYPEPSSELIDNIRKRLADVPPDVRDRAHHALMHEPIQEAGSILWKAGLCLSSHELYEYRKTLFPPNALMDPYTQGAPVQVGRGGPAEPLELGPKPVSTPPQPSVPTNAEESINIQRSSVEPLESVHEVSCPVVGRDCPPGRDLRQAQRPEGPDGILPGSHSVEPPHSLTTDGQVARGAALLNDLRDVIKRYVVLPELAAETLALWVVHTYAFTLRQVTTYIGVVSPEKRCGKTTLLELLGLLANRSLTASNISPSALFRVIQETQPTLLIDEADTFLQGRDELAGILNAGYRKGNSYVVRVAERKTRKIDEHRQPEFGQWTNERLDGSPGATEFAQYSCWCPKVMAAIGRLSDTLADRCIVITMQRKMPSEKCERMRQLNATDYRKRCAQFVREHSKAIAEARPEIPADLNDRAADIWEPLLAIADLAGGEWPQLARQAAHKLSTSDDELTLIGYFLKDLRNLMVLKNVDRMLSREIVTALNPMHHRPWEDLRRGREINEWWLGWQMRELGIRTKTMRIADVLGRGYLLEDIDAAFRRYVPHADLHSAPSPAQTPSCAGQNATDSEPPTSPPDSNACTQLATLMEQLLSGKK